MAGNTQSQEPDSECLTKAASAGANSYKFPDGGWECSKCQNYNFKGRK